MKLSCLVLLLLMLTQPLAMGQTYMATDSLKRLLMQARHDTSRVMLLAHLSLNCRFFDPDSSMLLAQQAMQLASRLNFTKGKVRALNTYGETRRFRGEFPEALAAQFKALQLSKNSPYLEGEEYSLGSIGWVYLDLDEYRQGLRYLFQAKKVNERYNNMYQKSRWFSGIGHAYERMNQLDSALYFQQQAQTFINTFPPSYMGTSISINLGVIYLRLGHFELALGHFQNAITSSYVTQDLVGQSRTQYRIAELYHTAKQPDSSLHYARLAFANSARVSLKPTILNASNLLVKLYEGKNNLDSAYHYQKVVLATKDAMYGQEKFQQLQLLTLSEQQRQQALIADQKDYQNTIRFYALLSGLSVVLLLAYVLWRNNQQKQKANVVLEKTLTELKSTQTQLIQKEKMASLGELTAGIAHEIQNPLNFVNNFSEVSTELVAELEEEQLKTNRDNELEAELLGDIRQNLLKITHHGGRASSIVKGMLEHSRAFTGERQPTDLNALADEYLRLAYHGLRGKDNTFNAKLTTDFDANLVAVEVAPQEIGRVLLNLYNNAFYATQQRAKLNQPDYQPTLTVSTTQRNGHVEVRVKDNGIGIPDAIRGKIFQPFFTTKPTGEGTGLGLSLSYDIVTKGHGGTLEVSSVEGEGTEFVVRFPLL